MSCRTMLEQSTRCHPARHGRGIIRVLCTGFGTLQLTTVRHSFAFACVARMKSLEWNIGLYISRVASKENLADDPSREEYGLMQRIKAEYVEPLLCPLFAAAQTWQALSIVERSASA